MTDRLADFGGVLKTCLNLLDKGNKVSTIKDREIGHAA
jgi:hypothetical protein